MQRLRSSMPLFNWKGNCMLCGEKAKIDGRHPERNKVHKVTKLSMRDKVVIKEVMHGHLRSKSVCIVVWTYLQQREFTMQIVIRSFCLIKGIVHQQNVLQVDRRTQV